MLKISFQIRRFLSDVAAFLCVCVHYDIMCIMILCYDIVSKIIMIVSMVTEVVALPDATTDIHIFIFKQSNEIISKLQYVTLKHDCDLLLLFPPQSIYLIFSRFWHVEKQMFDHWCLSD